MSRFLNLVFISFLILTTMLASGQHADCDKMVHLKGVFYQSGPVSGFGNKQELFNNSIDHNTKQCRIFDKEENTIWYLITMPDSGIFTFDIIPTSQSHDWDFILFEYKTKFCNRIEAKKIQPIRSNLSRSAKTGMSAGYKHKFVGKGINENYSRPLSVKKGEQYVLVVNNPKQSGLEHILKLNIKAKESEQESGIIAETAPTALMFKLKIKDKKDEAPLPSNINITGIRNYVLKLDNISKLETGISRKVKKASITVSSKGYMLATLDLKIRTNKHSVEFEMLLEPIVKGKKVNLNKIQFFGNRADFLPIAQGSLMSLLDFMQINETVKIEVEGHVNGPHNRNSKEYKELSEKRAKAVKTYLVDNGINQNRITYTGYGNSRMLYPSPKSESQMSANRRVEIKITAE